tara:strand:- start:943 stop:2133 length:1191 start_codon:yes stop_codon:yes gene_type:complete
MADPISLMAIAGLVYAGRKLSKPVEMYESNSGDNTKLENNEFNDRDITIRDAYLGPASPLIEPQITLKATDEAGNFGDTAPNIRTSGSEVIEMRDRFMYDGGIMNNLSPVERQNVGPGLGVDPNVPSIGGHQQLFRVNPVNVGAYKLTTLPGRSGPAFDVNGGRRGIVGEIGHNKPETTSFLLERRPATGGRAQGFSGRVPRSEHEKTKRTTNRSETGLRTDTLSTAAPKRTVSALTRAAEPTRNKKDGNIEAYQYSNMPAPNINKFAHGYLNSPATKIGESRVYGDSHTVDELVKYGFRPSDRRGKAGRPAGAGRMNVRADPLNQNGMLTGVRSDTSRIDGRVNSANGGWTQQYRLNDYNQFNAYKGNLNPNASQDALNLPKRQLANNPLTHSFS